MKQQIATFFNKGSSYYTKKAIIQKYVAKKCLQKVSKKFFPSILEIGAGGGILTSLLVNYLSFNQLITLDISKKMLALCPSKATKIVADGEHPPFKNQQFDLLISSSTMQWYEHGADSILKNLSVLKPLAKFSLAIFVDGTLQELKQASQKIGFASVFPLKTHSTYIDKLQKNNIKFFFELEEKKIFFKSVIDLLKNLKYTGTNYTKSKKGYSRKKFEEFCYFYESNFKKKEGVYTTYKILYMWN
ncbi:malonyl-CoA O-methyltransferase [Desulfonauticus submarinus]|uniref:Malonyl-CoA O-methyltransferase n=1 Tax=Desulfonauticus submarinus TaxID=206665 RepID=A0A1H0DLZ1_9BACT|nr:methyltransferase domain-containing protein [Desulfonauticus submarinus]SDN71079.1 malonyl-CoA O-methyltransferase [Desulfonauticus submarinus]